MPSRVPMHGPSPSLPAICTWQTCDSLPFDSNDVAQVTLPSDDAAQSLSDLQASPRFTAPLAELPSPKTVPHAGVSPFLMLQNASFFCAARTSSRHVAPCAAS